MREIASEKTATPTMLTPEKALFVTLARSGQTERNFRKEVNRLDPRTYNELAVGAARQLGWQVAWAI